MRWADVGAPGRTVFGLLATLPLAMVLAAGPVWAGAPAPDPLDVERSTALAACVPNVDLLGPDGLPASRPLSRGARVLLDLRQDRTNVLTIRSGDLNRIAELILATAPTDAAPLLVNIDTRLVDDRLAWAVPRVTGISGDPVSGIVWHFPSAVRIVVTGPPAPGVIFAPLAEVLVAPSPPPSPSPSPSPSPVPSLSPAATPTPSGSRASAGPTALPQAQGRPVVLPAAPAGLRPDQSRPVTLQALLAAAAPILPYGLNCAGPSPSPSPSATAEPSLGPGPGVPEPGTSGSAAASAKPAGERLMALASRPVTWFGVAGVFVGLALLIAVVAGSRARRRFR